MPAVRQIEQPEHGFLQPSTAGATHKPIEAAGTELRFAHGVEVHVTMILLERSENGQQRVNGFSEGAGLHEIQIVGGGMILRIFAVRRAHETADRQVDARGAILALIVTVGSEIERGKFPGLRLQHVLDDSIDLSIALTAAFISKRTRIADTGKDEAVFDPGEDLLV